MSTKTQSEIYFENFCEHNGLKLLPIPVGVTKTPDYTLTTPSGLIIVEVKEILPTPEELESNRLVKERGVGNAIHVTPGERVRKKIADCSPQIKARTQKQHPGMLVLWESGTCAGRHTEPYHVRIAMSGFEQVIVNVPSLGSREKISTVGMKHGPGRKMTENANTSISAVAVLCVPKEGEMLLQVFHNRYAAIPIAPELLRAPQVLQFVQQDDPSRTTKWEQV